jgi:hypothetical protein
MKKPFIILTTSLLMILSGCSFRSIPSPAIISTPEDAGLVWRECELTQSLYSNASDILQLANECFNQPEVSYDGDKVYTDVKHIGMWDFELIRNQDFYHTKYSGNSLGKETFILYKNDQAISRLSGKFTGYSPNLGLFNIGGKVAWEFADGDLATIIYDGQDVRDRYSLDQAFRPYSLDNKLIFIGQNDAKYFVIYDRIKFLPEFDAIRIAYCCEGILYSVVGIQGRYIFLGTRNDQEYLVQIEAIH